MSPHPDIQRRIRELEIQRLAVLDGIMPIRDKARQEIKDLGDNAEGVMAVKDKARQELNELRAKLDKVDEELERLHGWRE